MPLQAIEPRRLYRQIAGQLRELLAGGEFPAGARLPPERDLARQLNVSRPSVREALIALEVEGLVEVRMGSGIYVREAAAAAPGGVDALGEAGPLELIRARAMIEGEIAAAAAQHATKKQVAGIEEANRQMEEDAAQGRNPLAADRLFHVRLAEITDNSALIGVVSQLFDGRMGPIFRKLSHHFDDEKSWAAAITEHRAVIDAVAGHDPAAARARMQRHMSMAHRRFTASWTRQPKRGKA
jgi:DNA-binding FadR family transcriptional regulator